MKLRGAGPVVLKVLLKISLRVVYGTNTGDEAVLHRIQSLPPRAEFCVERNDGRRREDSGPNCAVYSARVSEGNRDEKEAHKDKGPPNELRAECSLRTE